MTWTVKEVTPDEWFTLGNMVERLFKITPDSTYTVDGDALTHAQLGFDDNPGAIFAFSAGKYGHRFEYESATQVMRVYRPQLGLSHKTINITDADGAASAGVAVYVHVDEVVEQGAMIGHLEAVTAGNADAPFQLWNGGPLVMIQDDDAAASGGVGLHFDENDTVGRRLSADFDRVTGTDTGPGVLIPTADGYYINVKDQDNPTGETGTVLVYFDDDAANAYERLLFVSPTNANGSDRLWTPGGQVPDGTDISDLTDVVIRVLGKQPVYIA